MEIGFIGGGVMAEAMISGLLNKEVTTPTSIISSDINPARRDILSRKYGVKTTEDNRHTLQGTETVVLAIKPQTLPQVIEELKGHLQPEQLVLSIVAGATVATISRGLDHNLVVRAMPNMPAQIGEGISLWTATEAVNERQKAAAKAILASLGKEIYVPDEKYINMATAVSGSGPAYILLVIESLIDAAVHIGLPRDLAREMVLQTVLGTTHFARASGKHPAELRDMVTSPGGTTVEGLLQLEKGGLSAILAQAVIAGYEKAKLLGESGGK